MNKTLTVLFLVLSGSVLASSFPVSNTCSVKMTDSLNNSETILSVTTESERNFTVADSFSKSSVSIFIDLNGYIKTSVSVPVVTIAELIENYTMKNDSQLKWEILGECTVIEKSLIVFMVMEWFYFG